jgi:hypothetical protein
LRLSTVGRAVLDGNGLAVSVGAGVDVNVSVIETVCVADGTKEVSVTDANAVSAGTFVSTGAGTMEVGVRVHPKEISNAKAKKTSVRLINRILHF